MTVGDAKHQAPSDLQLSRVGDLIVVSAPQPSLPPVLSESEQAVAQALLAGHSNAQIARERGTAVKTVANQLHAIYRKLGAGSREELVAILAGVPPARGGPPVQTQ